jgi:branched-subunit amino acid transport protein
MSLGLMALYIVAMALVTYAIRMVPMVFFRKKIKSVYLLSLLYYIPYAVLSAMTFPYIFYSTGNIITATVGTIAAIIASVCKRSLIIVAILACIFVLVTGYIIPLF